VRKNGSLSSVGQRTAQMRGQHERTVGLEHVIKDGGLGRSGRLLAEIIKIIGGRETGT
jgi:hypothetical protein